MMERASGRAGRGTRMAGMRQATGCDTGRHLMGVVGVVPGRMQARDDPRRDGAVDGSQLLHEPRILLAGGGVVAVGGEHEPVHGSDANRVVELAGLGGRGVVDTGHEPPGIVCLKRVEVGVHLDLVVPHQRHPRLRLRHVRHQVLPAVPSRLIVVGVAEVPHVDHGGEGVGR